MEIIVLSFYNAFNLNIFLGKKKNEGNVLSDPPLGEKKCMMAPSNGPIHEKMDDGNGLTLGKNREKKAGWHRMVVYSSSQSLSFSF